MEKAEQSDNLKFAKDIPFEFLDQIAINDEEICKIITNDLKSQEYKHMSYSNKIDQAFNQQFIICPNPL